MTLEQACGIVCNTVDKRTGRELDHREIYARYIDYLGGLDKVKQYIPISLKELRRAYKRTSCSIILVWVCGRMQLVILLATRYVSLAGFGCCIDKTILMWRVVHRAFVS